MQKYHKKHDNVYYIKNNYVLKPIYNDENKCINDTLSTFMGISKCKITDVKKKDHIYKFILNSSNLILKFRIMVS